MSDSQKAFEVRHLKWRIQSEASKVRHPQRRTAEMTIRDRNTDATFHPEIHFTAVESRIICECSAWKTMRTGSAIISEFKLHRTSNGLRRIRRTSFRNAFTLRNLFERRDSSVTRYQIPYELLHSNLHSKLRYNLNRISIPLSSRVYARCEDSGGSL